MSTPLNKEINATSPEEAPATMASNNSNSINQRYHSAQQKQGQRPEEIKKCWIQITSGNGPEECCHAVARVYEDMARQAADLQITFTPVSAVPSKKNGNFKSMLFTAEGKGLKDFYLEWKGSIQWIWQSRYRPNHKRKNWFVGVEVFPLCREPEDWLPHEVRIETTRAGGPGGQHVNKTESAVRVTHVATGLVVRADEERSQRMNKKLALARLEAKLKERKKEAEVMEDKERWRNHYALERGNSIRVYKGNAFRLVETGGNVDE